MVEIKIKKVEDGILPVRATEGAACYDCFARQTIPLVNRATIIPLGFQVQIPEGYHMKLFIRSGMALKTSLRIANCVGIIDSDYRGEVGLIAENAPGGYTYIRKGDRICQFMIEKNIDTKLVEVDELDETERGEGGFGSTGVK